MYLLLLLLLVEMGVLASKQREEDRSTEEQPHERFSSPVRD